MTRKAAPSPTLPEVSISAGEMANAIRVVSRKLLDKDLISQEGYCTLLREAGSLDKRRGETTWHLEIDRDDAVRFREITDELGRPVTPYLLCAIRVEQGQHSRPPFARLDLAIEMLDERRAPVARWHLDLANQKSDSMQPGPMIHLQYGGHFPGHREKDHPLEVPRWCHPPMEIVLFCEVIAANFYPRAWEELREDATWCSAVALGQKLCYTAYLKRMLQGLSVSSKTLLHSMWASEWALCP